LRTRLGFKSKYQKSEAMEVYCELNSDETTPSLEPLAASAGSDQEQSR
jgi:hypothetical protein